MPDEHDEDERVVRFAKRTNSAAVNDDAGAAPAPLESVQFGRWDNTEPPEREWAVNFMMPRSNVCLLSGEGAIGKSILIMQLCVAIAAGRDWIQQIPAPGVAIYYGAEDDEDELWRRFAAIARHYHVSFNELAGRLIIVTRAGLDAVLGVADRGGLVRPTILFTQLLELVTKVQPILIAVDTAADVFAGNENDRAQVRQFVGLLRRMAIAGRSALLLASHPSRAGIGDESGLSGSTAWHNSVRSRLYLKAATNGDASNDNGLRILEMKKSNYGPHTKEIPLRWDAGVLKPVSNLKSEVDRAALEAEHERIFMLLFGRYRASNRNLSDKAGRGYAPAEFVKEPEGKLVGAEALDAAMRRLFTKGKIFLETYGRPSRPYHKITSVELGL